MSPASFPFFHLRFSTLPCAVDRPLHAIIDLTELRFILDQGSIRVDSVKLPHKANMERGTSGNPYPRLNITTTTTSSTSDTLFSTIPTSNIDIVPSTHMGCSSDSSSMTSGRPQYSSLYERLISQDRHLLFEPVRSPVLASSPSSSQWKPSSKPLTALHKIETPPRSKRPMSFSGFPSQQAIPSADKSQDKLPNLVHPQPTSQQPSFTDEWASRWSFDFNAHLDTTSHLRGGGNTNNFHTVTDQTSSTNVGPSTSQSSQTNAHNTKDYHTSQFNTSQLSTYSEFAAHIAVFSQQPRTTTNNSSISQLTGRTTAANDAHEPTPPSSASPESLTDSHSGPPTPENFITPKLPATKKPERHKSLNSGRRGSLGPSCSSCRDRKITCTGPQEGRSDARCSHCSRRQATCEYTSDVNSSNKRGRKKAAGRSHEVGKAG